MEYEGAAVITERGLNRALLARQGLLTPYAAPPAQVVGSVGALQTQYWPSLLPALVSRTSGLTAERVYRELAAGRLLVGTLLRGTIHTVTAEEYPAYAAVTAGSKVGHLRRPANVPDHATDELRAELRAFTAQPRTPEQVYEFAESWVRRHPGVFDDEELAYQRSSKWRPFCTKVGLLRVPADGRWDSKTPRGLLAAPTDRPEDALEIVIRAHLRAYGPAAAEDVASWIGWNIGPVREAVTAMSDLDNVTDEAGRTLYDLPDAPRPDPDVEAPVRLLPWFDSALLAYAPKRRTRILPEAYQEIVWLRRNGQLKPTVLVDGLVAGSWALTSTRSTVTLTVAPLRKLTRRGHAALTEEAERLLAGTHPDADHEITIEP